LITVIVVIVTLHYGVAFYYRCCSTYAFYVPFGGGDYTPAHYLVMPSIHLIPLFLHTTTDPFAIYTVIVFDRVVGDIAHIPLRHYAGVVRYHDLLMTYCCSLFLLPR